MDQIEISIVLREIKCILKLGRDPGNKLCSGNKCSKAGSVPSDRGAWFGCLSLRPLHPRIQRAANCRAPISTHQLLSSNNLRHSCPLRFSWAFYVLDRVANTSIYRNILVLLLQQFLLLLLVLYLVAEAAWPLSVSTCQHEPIKEKKL